LLALDGALLTDLSGSAILQRKRVAISTGVILFLAAWRAHALTQLIRCFEHLRTQEKTGLLF